jgi:hypothetical protein
MKEILKTDISVTPLVFFHFSAAVSSALLALDFASGSHDAPRAGAGKVIATGHERKHRSPRGNRKENPSGEKRK